MSRALTILAAVAALAVSAAPASAGDDPPPGAMVSPSGGEILGNDWVKAPAPTRLTGITDGTSNTLQFVTATPRPGGGNGIIAILIG